MKAFVRYTMKRNQDQGLGIDAQCCMQMHVWWDLAMCIACGVVHWAHAKTHAAHTAVRRLIRNTGLDEHYTACECFHRDCPVIGARTFSHAFDEYNVNTYFCCIFFLLPQYIISLYRYCQMIRRAQNCTLLSIEFRRANLWMEAAKGTYPLVSCIHTHCTHRSMVCV